MIQFSHTSQKNLNTCIHPLRELAIEVAMITPQELDFSIVEGHRLIATQQEYFRRGLTTIDGVNQLGMHNYSPSKAYDLYPWTQKFGTITGHPDQIESIARKVQHKEEELFEAEIRVQKMVYGKFYSIAMLHKVAAEKLGIKIRWGGDWNGDGYSLDHTFVDLPHIEYVGPA